MWGAFRRILPLIFGARHLIIGQLFWKAGLKHYICRKNIVKSIVKMELNIIVAAGRDGAIGRGGNLIWRIPADLKRFKALTMGHPVIMGRKTWESLPKRPLPGRRNIVVTRNVAYDAPGAELATSPEEALLLCQGERSAGEGIREAEKDVASVETGSAPFVIGGEEIYKAFLPVATRIYLTEVEEDCQDADARLPFPLDPEVWITEERGDAAVTPDGVAYRYVTYGRR